MQFEDPHLVSIIIPTFNSGKYIAKTLKSVGDQSYQNWEVLITDDCSTDDTISVIEKFQKQEKRIRLFRNTVNSGAAISRNKSLENAKGRFVAFLDSDDLWKNTKLATQIKFMTQNKVPISCTSYDLIDEKGIPLGKTIRSVPRLDYKSHLKNTAIGMSTSMIDRTIVKDKFEFINIRTRQDCYLWITLLKRGHQAYGIEEPLVFYRVRSNSISANKFKAAKRQWYLYYTLENLGLFKSAYYFFFYAYNAVKKRIIT